MPSNDTYPEFIAAVDSVSAIIHQTAVEKGWWEGERNFGELIALIHAELSEALEYLRHENPPSDHIPEFTGLEEELADVIIRVLDVARAKKLRLAEAVCAKMEYNKTRTYKHGGKKF